MGLALVGRGKKGGWKRWWSQDMFGIFEVPAFLFHVGHNHLWGKNNCIINRFLLALHSFQPAPSKVKGFLEPILFTASYVSSCGFRAKTH